MRKSSSNSLDQVETSLSGKRYKGSGVVVVVVVIVLKCKIKPPPVLPTLSIRCNSDRCDQAGLCAHISPLARL